ncbi:MAG: class I SAM-dependent methyltransferase [Bacteroidia bacterium]
MKLSIHPAERRYLILVITAVLASLFILIVAGASTATNLLFLLLGALVATVGFAIVRLLVRLKDFQRANYQNIEAQMAILSIVKPRLPLPPTRGWAASPDFLAHVVREVKTRKPAVVAELGSGVSSIIVSYLLEQNQKGKLYSVDHEDWFLNQSLGNLEAHGLRQWVQPVYAPLATMQLPEGSWKWYDHAALEQIPAIDILIVDGPPQTIQKLARFPAMSVFANKFNPGACILVDDYARDDDTRMVDIWLENFPDFSLEKFNTEKGTAILRKSN